MRASDKARCRGTHRDHAVAALAVAGWLFTGCGSSSETTHDASTTRADGSAGTGVTTTGRGGASGTGGTAGTGTAGTGVAGSGAGGATVALDLGKACASATDCTGGLTCMKPTDNFRGNEGPPNGYCTKSCAQDSDCTASGGVCVDISPNATPAPFCLQTCTYGGTPGASKCHGRIDSACTPIAEADPTTTPPTPEVDICFPVCTQDSDCPSTLKCNLATSLCGASAAPGDPLGTHCMTQPDAGTSNCAGSCLAVGMMAGAANAAANFCSIPCVLGNLDACNPAGTNMSLATGGAHGVCALASSTAMTGDLGFCSQECDTAADCSDKADTGGTCDTSATSRIGHGICTWD